MALSLLSEIRGLLRTASPDKQHLLAAVNRGEVTFHVVSRPGLVIRVK